MLTHLPGLPDFSRCNTPKLVNMYEVDRKTTTWPLNNNYILYTKIFHTKVFKNIPKLGILVCNWYLPLPEWLKSCPQQTFECNYPSVQCSAEAYFQVIDALKTFLLCCLSDTAGAPPASIDVLCTLWWEKRPKWIKVEAGHGPVLEQKKLASVAPHEVQGQNVQVAQRRRRLGCLQCRSTLFR
jgi:hypothetical protein